MASPEVRAALAAGRPVVALETAIICHGMPRPANAALARDLEAAVRDAGAVPATTAVQGGAVRIGLEPAALQALAHEDGVLKCTTRDLPGAVARGATGATTVASTMFIAAQAGIRVMATGGIGGVHRGGEASLDVSADLEELARRAVIVVASGIKIILDLPRTMERLETLGVPVLGFGTGDLPGFYTRATGIPIPRAERVEDVAAQFRAQVELGLPGALLVVQPPPADLALDRAELEDLIEAARGRARAEGVRGPAETPFLLQRLAEASGGRTVRLNRALALANARLAGRLAAALAGPGDAA